MKIRVTVTVNNIKIFNDKERSIMKKMIIFQPAMCCSTGVCGPGVDPDLLRLSAT